jgi:predicted HTH domain antitoxin
MTSKRKNKKNEKSEQSQRVSVSARLTAEERDRLRAAAEYAGMSMSDLLAEPWKLLLKKKKKKRASSTTTRKKNKK